MILCIGGPLHGRRHYNVGMFLRCEIHEPPTIRFTGRYPKHGPGYRRLSPMFKRLEAETFLYVKRRFLSDATGEVEAYILDGYPDGKAARQLALLLRQ